MASNIDLSKIDNLEQCLRFGANMFRFHNDALVDVEIIKSLVNAKSSLQKEIDKSEKDLSLLYSQLEESRSDLSEAQSEIHKVLKEAQETAVKIIADAKSQADLEGRQILAKAVLDADKQRQEAAKAADDLAKTKDALSDVRADLIKHEEALAAVKAKFAALAG